MKRRARKRDRKWVYKMAPIDVPNACENSNYENGIYYISKTMDLNFVRKYTDSKILTPIRLLISQTREQIVYDINNIGN